MGEFNESKFRFGVISDLQEREGEDVDKALKPLKEMEKAGMKIDFIAQIGDLAATGEISAYIKKAKELEEQYGIEKNNGQLSENIAQYESTLNSPEYQNFFQEMNKKGVEQSVAIYALWLAKEKGVYEQGIEDMKLLIRNVTERLGEFKTEVKHIMGNADRVFPEKLEAVEKLLQEKGIVSYNQPTHLSLDAENSVVFWPSMAVDEKNEKQTAELFSVIEQFATQMRNKKTVLIFAHETPFKGPKKPGVYQDRLAESGFERNSRTPYSQFMLISRYVLELCRRLPAQTKIALTCGHMHSEREVIQAGMEFLKFDEQGKSKLRLFGAGTGKESDREKYELIPGGKRTIDLYYLPEGEVGIFEISNDGEVVYKKLPTDRREK